MNIFSGYISEGWRGFSWGINQKPKAVLSRTFSGHRSGSLERPRGRWEEGDRKLSDLNIFSGYISEGWRGFLQGIDQKPKAVWREYFFGVHFQRLEWLFAEDLPKAGGSLAGTSFQSTIPKAGGTFRRVSTQSRRLSRATLFRVISAGHLGSLAIGVERQPEADRR